MTRRQYRHLHLKPSGLNLPHIYQPETFTQLLYRNSLQNLMYLVLPHTFEGKRYDREHSLSQQESISFCLKHVLKDLAEESFHPPSHLQTAKHAKVPVSE